MTGLEQQAAAAVARLTGRAVVRISRMSTPTMVDIYDRGLKVGQQNQYHLAARLEGDAVDTSYWFWETDQSAREMGDL